MALLIFGLVLFPNVEKREDVATISVFWAVKVKDKDHVHAILEDVYHTLHLHFEKKGGLMLCYIPLLYKWFVSHVFKDTDVIEKMDECDWSQKLVGLTEKDIIWYPQGLKFGNVVTNYENFPNVPLIGSKGCINYNPVLVVRQLGYPITYRPDNHLLEGFVFHDVEDPIMLKKTILAWEDVHFRGEDNGKGIIGDKEPYY